MSTESDVNQFICDLDRVIFFLIKLRFENSTNKKTLKQAWR